MPRFEQEPVNYNFLSQMYGHIEIEISDYQENDHQPSADGTKAHGNYIATGLGSLDSFACRMDTRRRIHHGIQTDDSCTGLHDTSIYGA